MKDKRKKFRCLQHLYANLMGYFWLPCPICGKYFGGHEIADTSLMVSYSMGKCVCRNCEGKAEELNRENNYFFEEIK